MNFTISILFYFILYSFIGWMVEGIFSLFVHGKFLKDGFLMGPFKPMYGFAATILVLIEPYMPWYLFLLFAVSIPTLIEYITGYLMMNYFSTAYWDYSSIPFNFKGYICVPFSAAWVLLSFIVVYFIQPLIVIFYNEWQSIWYITVPIFIIYLISDFIYTLERKLTKKSVK